MRVVVVGAGIVGAATALALQEAGHEVVVLERESGAALGTSFANGGQLSFGHAEPWANPTVFGQLPRWLFASDSPVKFKGWGEAKAMRWAWQFLQASLPRASQRHAAQLLALAMQSRAQYQRWHTQYGWDQMWPRVGTLHLAGSRRALKHLVAHAGWQAGQGCDYDMLHPKDAVLKEPSLAHRAGKLAGAVMFPGDGCGDAHQVAQAMLREAVSLGAELHYGEALEGIERARGQLYVSTAHATMVADKLVLCAGVDAAKWASQLGMALPLMPLQGYSLTYEVTDALAPYLPHHAITDGAAKMVISRLGNRLRVAGFGDMCLQGDAVLKARQTQLHHYAARWFPALEQAPLLHRWVGQRPALPNAVPICAETTMQGVWLNVGHGSLGWTLAAGSAKTLAVALCEQRWQPKKQQLLA